MRSATPIVMLIAAVLMAGCDSLAPVKPDPAGDAVLVSQMKRACAAAPPLARVNATDRAAAIIAAADADDTVVTNLLGRLVNLTPSISSRSPLAPQITDLALMLYDMQMRYGKITAAAQTHLPAYDVSLSANLALLRATQARSDLARMGISSCLE